MYCKKNPFFLGKKYENIPQKNSRISIEMTMENNKNVLYWTKGLVIRRATMKKRVVLIAIMVICAYMFTACAEENEHVAQGMQYVEENKYRDAINSFEKGLEKGEEPRLVYRGMGIAYMGLAEYENAIEAFLMSLDSSNGIIDSMDYDINYYLAAAYYKNGQLKECESTYDSIIDLEGQDAIAYELRGKVRLEMGRYEEAMEDFDKAISLEEKDYDMLLEIYKVLETEGYGEAGRGYLERALEEDKKSMTETQKGMMYYFLEDYETARQILEKEKNTGKQAVIYLGMTYEKLGDYNYAGSLYNNYLLEQPDAEIYNQLGLCKLQMEEYEAALTAFQEGMKLENCPCLQSLKFNEIVAYEYLGEFEKAKVLMESYLLTYPDDADAKRERDFLQTR